MKISTNAPTHQQNNKSTNQRTNKPTNQQTNEPTNIIPMRIPGIVKIAACDPMVLPSDLMLIALSGGSIDIDGVPMTGLRIHGDSSLDVEQTNADNGVSETATLTFHTEQRLSSAMRAFVVETVGGAMWLIGTRESVPMVSQRDTTTAAGSANEVEVTVELTAARALLSLTGTAWSDGSDESDGADQSAAVHIVNADLMEQLANKADKSEIPAIPEIPTRTSQLTNDSGFLTEHQDVSQFLTEEDIRGKQDKLTAGENITIEDGVISSTGGGSSVSDNDVPDINIRLEYYIKGDPKNTSIGVRILNPGLLTDDTWLVFTRWNVKKRRHTMLIGGGDIDGEVEILPINLAELYDSVREERLDKDYNMEYVYLPYTIRDLIMRGVCRGRRDYYDKYDELLEIFKDGTGKQFKKKMYYTQGIHSYGMHSRFDSFSTQFGIQVVRGKVLYKAEYKHGQIFVEKAGPIHPIHAYVYYADTVEEVKVENLVFKANVRYVSRTYRRISSLES